MLTFEIRSSNIRNAQKAFAPAHFIAMAAVTALALGACSSSSGGRTGTAGATGSAGSSAGAGGSATDGGAGADGAAGAAACSTDPGFALQFRGTGDDRVHADIT